MTEAGEFRKALTRQAYLDFLDWAWRKDEIMEQYLAFVEEARAQGATEDAEQGFQKWVTDTYWGEVE